MTDHENQDPDLSAVEQLYDQLENGAALEALATARTLLAADGDDPVVRFLAGVACLDLDRPGEAAIELRHAVKLDPDDGEFRAQLSNAEFRCCQFDAALEQAECAIELDDELPDAHATRGLVLERQAAFDQADAAFARAAELDEESFPMPVRVHDEIFEAALLAARKVLPENFQKHLGAVTVTVDLLPTEELLNQSTPPLDPELLGLFVGVPLSEAGANPSGELPPQIWLFKRNLERVFPDFAELETEIARTLHHELGHYLGLDEAELEAIDLG